MALKIIKNKNYLIIYCNSFISSSRNLRKSQSLQDPFINLWPMYPQHFEIAEIIVKLFDLTSTFLIFG